MAEGREPAIQGGKWRGIDPIQPALGIGTHAHKSCFAQRAEMLGRGRLAQRQSPLNVASGVLTTAQHIENTAANGIGQG
jgi:hypothetical protein